MTPPCYTFPAAELCERVQLDVHGRQRKMPYSRQSSASDAASQATPQTPASRERTGQHAGIDLVRDCELLSSMVQYSCAVMHPEMRDSPVRCWPVQRMFRRCQDRSGSFTVETTAWEATQGTKATVDSGLHASRDSDKAALDTPTTPHSRRPETLRTFG